MPGRGTTGPTASSRYHGSSNIRPKKGSSKGGAQMEPCYPPSIDFASEPSQNKGLVEAGSKGRRPGGKYRTSFKPVCNAPDAPTEPIFGKDGKV